MRTSPARARPATTSIARKCTTEKLGRRDAASLGPADPAGPLGIGRADRVQLVVGAQPSHRLAHMVGVRDPDLAYLPLAVGLRRQLYRAVHELCPGAARP